MLSGIILAAGKSSRMNGKIKALLELNGTTFVEKIVRDMLESGVDEVFVVLGAHYDLIAKAVSSYPVKILRNENWESGQLSSLRVALDNLSMDSRGIIFTLVDHPLVKASTYQQLIDKWEENRERIVLPLYRGRKGHPTIFPHSLFSELLYGELPNGARDILYKHRELIDYVPVDDVGVVRDIDTEEDYRSIKTN